MNSLEKVLFDSNEDIGQEDGNNKNVIISYAFEKFGGFLSKIMDKVWQHFFKYFLWWAVNEKNMQHNSKMKKKRKKKTK